MTHKERWHAVMNYRPFDRIPNYEFGYWDETLEEWHKQGLPAEVTDNAKAHRFFGFDPKGSLSPNIGMIPPFEHKVLEETEETVTVRDSAGVLSVQKKHGSSIPKYIEFPVKTRRDFEELKERYDPRHPGRYPEDWDRRVEEARKADYPIGISLGGFYGWLRGWMGVENLSIAFALEPEWVHEMLDFICEFILEVIDRAVSSFNYDFGAFWEDMCFNKGPLISPKMFREFLVPRYKAITDKMQKCGCEIFYVDCDGNILELVELWYEGGVNCMFPCEVHPGSDPFVIREKFSKGVRMMGGVNKRALAAGKEAIDRELERLLPLVEDGGFIPHIDHRVPPDVTYENYLYYLERKKEGFGIVD